MHSSPPRRIPILVLLVGVVGLALAVLGDVACTPKQAETAARIASPVVRASCVVLRAVLDDGTVNELCATAADLAPLLEEILRARKSGEVPTAATSTPLLAVALDPPPVAATYRRAPRRRCVAWQHVGSYEDGGGSTDAAPPPSAVGSGRDGGR